MSEKTPDDDSVEMDPVTRLREAWCHENATWGDDGSAELERVLAKIRAGAVAEYRAQEVDLEVIEVAAAAVSKHAHLHPRATWDALVLVAFEAARGAR